MQIVLDENLPSPLKHAFGAADTVMTVQELGWAGITNGELLKRLNGRCDVFVTADKRLRYQQRLAGRTFAIVQLPTNRLPLLLDSYDQIAALVASAKPGDYLTLD
jgi:hypothetical protein